MRENSALVLDARRDGLRDATSEANAWSPKSFMTSQVAGRLLATALSLLAASILAAPGRARTCPVNVPHLQGTWRTLPYLMPINPISATLLHTGQVLIVAGSENDASNNSP